MTEFQQGKPKGFFQRPEGVLGGVVLAAGAVALLIMCCPF